MRAFRRHIIGGLTLNLILACALQIQAQDLRNPRFTEQAFSGFTYIFNMDYGEARKTFLALEKDFPQHPAPPLYLASIIWLEEMIRRQDVTMDRFVSPMYFTKKTALVMPAQERSDFFRYIQRCQSLATALIEKNPKDFDARYFLATAYGLRASFAITIDHKLREAFSNGNKAYDCAKQLIQDNPNYYDAYLITGIYEYVVGSIPWYIKWAAYVIGFHGSKEAGFSQIRSVSEKGHYLSNEAKVVEMVLFMREGRYTESLSNARILSAKYPRSYLFALNISQILRIIGKKEEAVAALLNVEKQADAGVPNFDKLQMRTFRYQIGSELMKLGRWDLARERFQKSIENRQTPDRERSLSHLSIGRILDANGRHSEAIKQYQTVLTLADYEDSHEQARKLLKQPR